MSRNFPRFLVLARQGNTDHQLFRILHGEVGSVDPVGSFCLKTERGMEMWYYCGGGTDKDKEMRLDAPEALFEYFA
jgi:hypothetical protein